MKIYLNIYYFFSVLILSTLSSCVDEVIYPEPPQEENEIDPNIPKEILEGYSVSFNINLSSMGGLTNDLTRASSTTTNPYLREIENFVDLEKLRILFFVCVPDIETFGPEVDFDPFNPAKEWERYHTKDYFLFESKSRWVSNLTQDQSLTANWQVTAPVFTYGNNEEYDWESIRYALENYDFKIAILANRPDYVNFGNFDGLFVKEVEFKTDRGPNWGPEDSWANKDNHVDGTLSGAIGVKNLEGDKQKEKVPTINGLHHCQWDAVYASKNNGTHVYDYIMENPVPANPVSTKANPTLKVPPENIEDDKDKIGETNMMGALSYWTQKKKAGEKDSIMTSNDANYYFHPNRSQGIPMYGVQKFRKLGTAWAIGTPFNVSNQSGYSGKNIHLLRSLVKLELKIPKRLTQGNKTSNVVLRNVHLQYSNVMARCEPLDVETPTELLWAPDENTCEWNDIFNYGPIITGIKGEHQTGENIPVGEFQRRYAWFYGAWKHWWHFNEGTSFNGLEYNGYLDIPKAKVGTIKDYPHIFNPVIQRNGAAYIKDCIIEDPNYYYYVVYTGERNINDPSNVSKFTTDTAEVAFFSFSAQVGKGDPLWYYVQIADYKDENTILGNYKKGGLSSTEIGKYREDMAPNTNGYWNWPLLRNHVYTFTVRKLGTNEDVAGIDVDVVSTENRQAPTLEYN